MTSVQDLGGTWTLVEKSIPATVPGCVHTHLLNAGLIPDPFHDDNEKAVAWVGHADWTYARDIAWEGDVPDRLDLVFEGLARSGWKAGTPRVWRPCGPSPPGPTAVAGSM
jgi:beta-mannosidase